MKIKFYAALIFVVGLFGSQAVLAQNNFRSAGNGNWNYFGTWEEETSPGIWENTNNTPTSASGTITIRNGNNVTITENVTIDQTNVEFGAVLTVSSGKVVVIDPGTAGIDMTVSGSFINNGRVNAYTGSYPSSSVFAEVTVYGNLTNGPRGIFNSETGYLIFEDGSEYHHQVTDIEGTTPKATWHVNSTCFIEGVNLFGASIPNSPPINLNQNFGNFIWNPAEMNDPVEFGNNLKNVKGNLEILSTGDANILFSYTAPGNLVVGKNFKTAPNTNVYFDNIALDIKGNMEINGAVFDTYESTVTFSGETVQSLTTSGKPLNNVIVSGTGGLNLTEVTDFNGNLTVSSTLNANSHNIMVGGNVDLSGGTFTPGSGTLTLDGGTQNVTTGGQTLNQLVLAGTDTKTFQDAFTISGNLTVNSGVTFDQNGNNISIGGNWTNNGTFNAGSNSVTFTGSSAIISGTTTFYDLNVNSASAINEGTTDLQNLLTLGAGVSFDADGSGSGSLKLISSATRTAGIATIPDGSSVTGAVTVQRFIPGDGNVFYYLANPVLGATRAGWDDESASPGSYYYHEPVVGDKDAGYTRLWEPSFELTPGQGFTYNIRNTSPIVLNVSGNVAQGPVSFNETSYTPTEFGNEADGWNLVGNPYPSAIDWITDGWTIGSSWTGTAYVPNTGPNRSLSFVTHSRGTGISLNGGGEIASGQSFWVKAESSTDLTFVATEEVKTNETTTAFLRTQGPRDYMIVALNQGSLRDETAVVFRDGASGAYDSGLDSEKMQNTIFNISSLTSDKKDVALNVLPWDCQNRVTLNIHNVTAGSYTLDFSKLGSFTKGVSFTLLDEYTNSTFVVSDEAVYPFQVNEDTGSKAAGRFSIKMEYTSIARNLAVASPGICTGQAATVNISNSETDVQYLLVQDGEAFGEAMQGNGGELSLTVPAERLLSSENTFSILAKKGECMEATLDHQVHINPESMYNISGVEDGNTCGAGSVTLTASGAPENGSYNWYSSAESRLPIEGASGSTFTTPKLKQSATYYVSAVNSLGCESTERVAVQATVVYLKEPEIREEKEVLFSSVELGNQWFKDGVEIGGATADSYRPTESGRYVVKVTTDGCEVSSIEHPVKIKKKDEVISVELKLVPNPAKDFVNILYGERNINYITVRIFQPNGIMLLEKTIHNQNPEGMLNARLQLDQLRTGIYIVKIQDDQGGIHYARLLKK